MRGFLPVLLVACLTPGCGYKGPLYLPEKPAATAPATTAPAADVKSDEKKNPNQGSRPNQ